MKHIVKLDGFGLDELNEMAKVYPVGSILKVNSFSSFYYTYNYSRSGSKWNSYGSGTAGAPSELKGGVAYIKVVFSGRSWLEGKVLYTNCFAGEMYDNVKISVKHVEQPGPEYKIFVDNDAKIKEAMGQSFYLDGTEPEIMSMDGKKATIKEGEYTVKSLNFDLTAQMDTVVLHLALKGSRTNTACIKLSDIDNLTKELSKEHNEVVAEWFAKNIGCEVTYDGRQFVIPKYKVTTTSSRDAGFPDNFNAGPFLSEDMAKNFIKDVEKIKGTLSFDTTTLKVSKEWSSLQMSLEEIVNFARKKDVKVNMKDLLSLKKGHVQGKKLGLLDSLEWKKKGNNLKS
jgi:hypothetical protein